MHYFWIWYINPDVIINYGGRSDRIVSAFPNASSILNPKTVKIDIGL